MLGQDADGWTLCVWCGREPERDRKGRRCIDKIRRGPEPELVTATCTLGGLTDEMDRPFPPDPKVPEETSVPGPKLALSPQQAKSVAEMAKRCSYVEVEDSGAGYLKVRSFDSEGEPIDERWIDSDGFDRLRSLLRHKDLPE